MFTHVFQYINSPLDSQTDTIKTIKIFDHQTLIRMKLVRFNVSEI